MVSDSKDMEVRGAAENDLARVAKLHREQFSDHFLGCYPTHVIKEFYRQFLDDCIFNVAYLHGNLAGFVMGGETNILKQRRALFVRRNWLKLLFATILLPRLWLPAISRARGLRITDRHHAGFESSAKSRLLSIAVSDSAKGAGVAGALVESFERSLLATRLYGLSVHEDNERAIGFYAKKGFVEEGRRSGSVFFVKTITEK
jgi:ribosomal protein S18 acetylase RimI-like enzyme